LAGPRWVGPIACRLCAGRLAHRGPQLAARTRGSTPCAHPGQLCRVATAIGLRAMDAPQEANFWVAYAVSGVLIGRSIPLPPVLRQGLTRHLSWNPGLVVNTPLTPRMLDKGSRRITDDPMTVTFEGVDMSSIFASATALDGFVHRHRFPSLSGCAKPPGRSGDGAFARGPAKGGRQ
jgi:hypothetical protein